MWDEEFIGKKLVEVVYAEFEYDRKPPTRLFFVFEDEEGSLTHVEVYSYCDGLCWSSPRRGGSDWLTELRIATQVHYWPAKKTPTQE